MEKKQNAEALSWEANAVIEKALKYARTRAEAGELLQESVWSERDGLVYLSGETVDQLRTYIADHFPEAKKVTGNVRERTSLLPDGWKWEHFTDGSGCLHSPEGKRFFEYDLQTREFQISMDKTELSYHETLGLREFVRYAEEKVLDELGSKDRKKRLFVDMDGTLAEFKPVDTLEKLYEKGYFANLKPQMAVVGAVRFIMQECPDIEVHILSAVLSDSKYALQEKNAWLDQYLPEMDAEHRLFLPCGTDKKEVISGGVTQNDFLLDDYTVNLNSWESPAKGIKLLNGINHTNGTWQKAMVSWNRMPETLAAEIAEIVRGRQEARTKELTPERTETEAEDRNEVLNEAPKRRPGRRR